MSTSREVYCDDKSGDSRASGRRTSRSRSKSQKSNDRFRSTIQEIMRGNRNKSIVKVPPRPQKHNESTKTGPKQTSRSRSTNRRLLNSADDQYEQHNDSKNEQQTITYNNMPSNIRSITATISAEGQTERVSNFRNVECDEENEVALSSGERDSHQHLYEQQEAELRDLQEQEKLINEELQRYAQKEKMHLELIELKEQMQSYEEQKAKNSTARNYID